MESLRSSMSGMSPYDQMVKIKETQGEKLPQTTEKCMSFLSPTPELIAAFPSPLNSKGEGDEKLMPRYVNYVQSDVEEEVEVSKEVVSTEVSVEATTSVDATSVDATSAATTDSKTSAMSMLLDAKTLVSAEVAAAADSLVLRTNGVG